MRSIELALQGAYKVLLAGLAFGTGLPVVYALAMRVLTVGATTTVDEHGENQLHPTILGRLIAGVLLAILVGAVALGIAIIASAGFGKAVSFDGIIPMIVDKKK